MGDTIENETGQIVGTVDDALRTDLADPGPFSELGLSVAMVVLVIAVHGWCLGRISALFARRLARLSPTAASWRLQVLMAVTIALLVATHLAETLLWAAPIRFLNLIDGFRNAYFYTLEAYTTLGEGSISLPADWGLLGPVIAISGLFTFSWTGSVLVYVMSEVGRRAVPAAPGPGNMPH